MWLQCMVTCMNEGRVRVCFAALLIRMSQFEKLRVAGFNCLRESLHSFRVVAVMKGDSWVVIFNVSCVRFVFNLN